MKDNIVKIVAVEEINKLAASYFRAIDTQIGAVLRELFDDDATAYYRDAPTDP